MEVVVQVTVFQNVPSLYVLSFDGALFQPREPAPWQPSGLCALPAWPRDNAADGKQNGYDETAAVAVANLDADPYLEIVIITALFVEVFKLDGFTLSTAYVDDFGKVYTWGQVTPLLNNLVRVRRDGGVTVELRGGEKI